MGLLGDKPSVTPLEKQIKFTTITTCSVVIRDTSLWTRGMDIFEIRSQTIIGQHD